MCVFKHFMQAWLSYLETWDRHVRMRHQRSCVHLKAENLCLFCVFCYYNMVHILVVWASCFRLEASFLKMQLNLIFHLKLEQDMMLNVLFLYFTTSLEIVARSVWSTQQIVTLSTSFSTWGYASSNMIGYATFMDASG